MNGNNELNQNVQVQNNNKKRKINIEKKYIIIGFAFVIYIVIIIIALNKNKTIDNSRVKFLSNIKESKMMKFKIDDNTYIIGDKLSNYKKNYNYTERFDKINPDSVVISLFSRNNNNDFLGFIYCPSYNECKYDESILIKANFYSKSKVIIDEKIDFSSTYNDFVKVYGEPLGKYYQDKTMYVWSTGNKIGDPYIIAGFDTGSLFSTDFADKISIGVWWYENELSNTVVKEIKNEKENSN